jgi:hypothetical protein
MTNIANIGNNISSKLVIIVAFNYLTIIKRVEKNGLKVIIYTYFLYIMHNRYLMD